MGFVHFGSTDYLSIIFTFYITTDKLKVRVMFKDKSYITVTFFLKMVL